MDDSKAEEMLRAPGTALEEQGAEPVDMAICGAIALLMRGLIHRPTRDIDGLGLVVERNGALTLERPLLRGDFGAAVERVGNLYGEGKHRLSTAATILHGDTALPADIIAEAEPRRCGGRLTVRLCSRRHMVFLKLWAAVNRGEPDIGDLLEMAVSAEEAAEAAAWCLAQDAEALERIAAVLEMIGHGEVAERIGGGD